ncbi:MAG: hypothetical protein AUK37_03110 [Rhodobacterales bacterium CG2_30_65_12]|nr:MAG: hypothetical protein AUK37_03110 [Rhodobacterales bacterium CG2_30_65_12]
MTPTLVLTRPEAQSREIAATLDRSVPVIISPVMQIVAAGRAPEIANFAGVVLTSANALVHAPDLQGKPAYCVGERTARAARDAGAEVRLVARDADDLVARVEGDGPLLHLRGEHARGSIAERLNSAGIVTEYFVIYRQEALPLSAEAKAAIEGTSRVVLPLYSPRTARLLGERIGQPGPAVQPIAMSEAVARAWRATTGTEAEVVPEPSGEAMLKAIGVALNA